MENCPFNHLVIVDLPNLVRWWFSITNYQRGYPLVNIQKAMERSTIFHGKIHYFDWAIFHCYVSSPKGKSPLITINHGSITIKSPFSYGLKVFFNHQRGYPHVWIPGTWGNIPAAPTFCWAWWAVMPPWSSRPCDIRSWRWTSWNGTWAENERCLI